MPMLENVQAKPKVIFFTDFDGTITLHDSNDWMTDNLGFGQAKRKAENKDTLEGKNDFRDSFQRMIDSIKTPFPECLKLLRENIKLDPGFAAFYKWSRTAGVPVVVLSSGMVPVIRTLLVHLVGPEANDIEIISNDVIDRPPRKQHEEGGWQLKFHDNSSFGHDKSLAIREYVRYYDSHPNEHRPVMLYAGDGVSDLSAARETDLLFAKAGMDLVTYCEREHVPYTTFEDWRSIEETTRAIYEGKTDVKTVAKNF